MMQPSDSQKSQPSSNPNVTSVKTASVPVEQATVGRSVVIKGEVSGTESLYIDGRIEGTVNFDDNRVTIGRNGVVAANVTAREVVILGKVKGNIQCTDRVDIRSEGSLTGDVITQRISVEDGAILKGSVQVRAAEHKNEKPQPQAHGKPASTEPTKPAASEQPKAAAAVAGA
jgi:cytoskeletal protein CcmA (bactofilin family)